MSCCTLTFSFFMHMHVFHLCYFRLEMPLKRRCQNMGSILFTLPVFPQIRTRSHLYRAFKWVSAHNEITQCCCKLPYFHHTQESSGRIIFLNCYPKYAREILCQVCANCSMLVISETGVHVQVHVSLCAAGFHTGHGATKLCMDHIRMVSWIILEAEPKQWNFLPGLWSVQRRTDYEHCKSNDNNPPLSSLRWTRQRQSNYWKPGEKQDIAMCGNTLYQVHLSIIGRSYCLYL